MENQMLINVLIMAGGSLVAWWAKTIQSTQAKQQDQIVELVRQIGLVNIELAKNYMPRQELQQTLDRIFHLLEEIRKEVRHA